MARVWSIVLVGLAMWTSFGHAQPPRLDMNDVTWLWPAPLSGQDLERIIVIDQLRAVNGDSIWSDEQFADVLRAADSDAAKVGDNRIKLPESVREKNVWRIAAFRVDPTAPGGHELIRQNLGERPQIRLVLQPVTIKDGDVTVHDIAVHLVFDFVRKEGDKDLPDRDLFKQIVCDLDELNERVVGSGVTTSGEPLGVHPGLKAKTPGLQDELVKFFSKHLRSDRLSAMAVMGLDGPEPWIFLALSNRRTPDGRFHPVPFLPAQMLSMRNGPGEVSPFPPMANNRSSTPQTFLMPPNEQDRRGVSTAVMFKSDFDLDAPAVIGRNADGETVADEKVRNRDIPDVIADPIRTHFFNTDCVSCHTETRRRLRFKISPGDFAFRVDSAPPQIDEDVLPKHDWNVRNLGWFPPSRFIGGGPTVATVTQRTANETAEVVQFIEKHYRDSAQSEAESDSDENQEEHQEGANVDSLPDDTNLTYLDQGWTPQEREEFYFRGQGSQLVPYLWFINLERADGEELLRSNRHLRSLGFIPQPPHQHLNPDGLPIGFVKDSNPATIAQKSGLLGPDFERDQYPPTDDWLGFTCAACHTADLEFRGKTVRIDGGASLADMESFLRELASAMRSTLDNDQKFNRFEHRISDSVEGDIDTSSLRNQLRAFTPAIERLASRNKAEHPYGLGRLDAFGAILNQICEASLHIPENHRPSNAPVSYPFLWDTPHLDWVQWNSSVDIPLSRNVGEVLGVFAHTQLTGRPDEGQFRSSARLDYLHQLETQLRELRAPQWPEAILGEIDRKKSEAGKRLFADNCAHCHNVRDEKGNFAMTAPNEFGRTFIKTTSIPFNSIGTDRQMAVNFITRTAKPGALGEIIRPTMERPDVKEQLRALEQLMSNLNLPQPDFTNEVPAAMVLAAAVRGVTSRDLDERLRHRTDEERQVILLDLKGHRSGGKPPHGGAGYKARPLNGVWATAPFGHNGSVPNLYQWLLPEEQRVNSFFVGSREFDPKRVGYRTDEESGSFQFQTQSTDGVDIPGNSNSGHSGPGHTDFTDEERWQLIEYLKTLR